MTLPLIDGIHARRRGRQSAAPMAQRYPHQQRLSSQAAMQTLAR